jgi:hypothetical protein
MSTSMHSAGDELARQRRKREARLLDRQLVEFPTLTVADVVAEVLATVEEHGDIDVRSYLAVQGYRWATIEQVVEYVGRQDVPVVPQLRR